MGEEETQGYKNSKYKPMAGSKSSLLCGDTSGKETQLLHQPSLNAQLSGLRCIQAGGQPSPGHFQILQQHLVLPKQKLPILPPHKPGNPHATSVSVTLTSVGLHVSDIK